MYHQHSLNGLGAWRFKRVRPLARDYFEVILHRLQLLEGHFSVGSQFECCSEHLRRFWLDADLVVHRDAQRLDPRLELRLLDDRDLCLGTRHKCLTTLRELLETPSDDEGVWVLVLLVARLAFVTELRLSPPLGR